MPHHTIELSEAEQKIVKAVQEELFGKEVKHSLNKSSKLLCMNPFLNCAIDYCGMFPNKSCSRKNSPDHKAYAAIFVCCPTGTIHCKLVSSFLTNARTQAFGDLTAIPEPRITYIVLNRLSLWQFLERIRQHFWKRWHVEYLQHPTKWKQSRGQTF